VNDLERSWKLRNTLVAALELAYDEVDNLLRDAPVDDLVEFVGSFSPARAPGPEWVMTFDRVVEQIWAVVDADRIKALENAFRGRGPNWLAVANSFVPEHGEQLRATRWQPAGARRPAVVLR